MAQDVWVYDFAANKDTRLTDFVGTDRLPMWIGDTIYFVSDREKTLNVFSVSPDGGEAKKITDHNVFDARHAAAGPKKIVYEHGGDIIVTSELGKGSCFRLELPGVTPQPDNDGTTTVADS